MSGNPIQLYFRYMAISLRGQMQYRASFLLQSAGQLIFTGVEFFAVWALFGRFGSLRGWTLAEVALFYGIVNCAFAIAEAAARGFDIFPQVLRTGDFDRMLLRPRSTALQVAGMECQLMRIGRLAQGGAVLGWSLWSLGIWHSPVGMAFLAAVVAGGVCLFAGLFVVQATLSFWTIETLEIMNTVTYGGTETGQYPLPIYRPWFRLFFTLVVPIACANYLPAAVLLGRDFAPGVPLPLLCCSPLAGPIFLLATLRLWRFGVRHYESTGS